VLAGVMRLAAIGGAAFSADSDRRNAVEALATRFKKDICQHMRRGTTRIGEGGRPISASACAHSAHTIGRKAISTGIARHWRHRDLERSHRLTRGVVVR